MKIRRLSEKIINQIAAGEVIERPSVAIKELIENSLDAESTCIETVISEGGKSFFQVSDNGCGMTSDEIRMAVQRHCTSKISDDLDNIHTFGFRGEALPSIGSVAHLTLMSRPSKNEIGAQISVSGDKISPICASAINPGTIVKVQDLFFTIPARLNFLKSTQVETNLIADVIRRIAIAYPAVRFTLSTTGSSRAMMDFPSTSSNFSDRISQVIGKDFIENSIEIDTVSQDMRLRGYAGIPTFNRGKTNQVYTFVNGRAVQDKFLFATIRAAYAETIPQGRYPVIILLLEIPPKQVDVNVHPAKSDVRFRYPRMVRNFIISSIQQSISQKKLATSSSLSTKMLSSFQKENTGRKFLSKYISQDTPSFFQQFSFQENSPSTTDLLPPETSHLDHSPLQEDTSLQNELGTACAQIHQNYIIAQTADALIIVDQHAAHERLIFDKIREDMHNQRITSQILLIPEIIDLLEGECSLVIEHAEELLQLGITLEHFGSNAIAIRSIPAILANSDISTFLRDLVDEIIEYNTTNNVIDKTEKILATIACHASIRAGREMQLKEMNMLLRKMERNPNSSQCNHGRPTFIKLKLSDIERLFGR
ncbi:DNA mismatch repair endonuclease MutL [Candidatus Liberibacter sp.]|uniref:DNA mismatch repair endonuclease MutL n=1 Tax=Candidatus Liberibacter sp. TaxID=34022 RepID=UPI0015F52886|nr:DNA mismatch repair endonuclease MutL [Candidatus Liberibacter sp.]MBA5724223.1 DNA mismatch repair endonuclease MutL [Candidatus Liberibacter sp.]